MASLSKVIENSSPFLPLMKKYLNFVEGSSSRSSDVNGIWELIRSIHLYFSHDDETFFVSQSDDRLDECGQP